MFHYGGIGTKYTPDVSAGAKGLHESLSSGLGDGPQVVNQVGLGHADSGVLDRQGVVSLNGRSQQIIAGHMFRVYVDTQIADMHSRLPVNSFTVARMRLL